MDAKKISWDGCLLSVQPRTWLLRSFDQRSHNYREYALYLQGAIDGSHQEICKKITTKSITCSLTPRSYMSIEKKHGNMII